MSENNSKTAGGILSGMLSALGISAVFVCDTVTANTTIYHFNLDDIKDLQKVKKACALLSARLHENITQEPSECGDFALVIARKRRDVIPFKTAFLGANLKPLEAVIGLADNGEFVKLSVDDMISALCVGTSGSGKSTFLHAFINSLTCSTSAERLGLVMIDCKRSELVRYNAKTAHLMCKVCTDAKEALQRLNQIIDIMQQRYAIMEQRGLNTCPDDFCRILIIVDELAELMLSADKTIADGCRVALTRLCQLGRACGIHCLLCTQSPRVAVVDGMIQTNTPTKFALRTSNTRESVIAIGHGGCERLFGRGDMLYKSADSVQEIRLQVPYISVDEMNKLDEHLPTRQCCEPTATKKPTPTATSQCKPTLWQRIKTALTVQDCIDYDIIDED